MNLRNISGGEVELSWSVAAQLMAGVANFGAVAAGNGWSLQSWLGRYRH